MRPSAPSRGLQRIAADFPRLTPWANPFRPSGSAARTLQSEDKSRKSRGLNPQPRCQRLAVHNRRFITFLHFCRFFPPLAPCSASAHPWASPPCAALSATCRFGRKLRPSVSSRPNSSLFITFLHSRYTSDESPFVRLLYFAAYSLLTQGVSYSWGRGCARLALFLIFCFRALVGPALACQPTSAGSLRRGCRDAKKRLRARGSKP